LSDKYLEKKRYDDRANKLLNNINNQNLHKNILPLYLLPPYNYYFESFKKLNKDSKLLEIGAGTGENSLKLIEMCFKVCTTDISPQSVRFMKKKFSKFKNFQSKIADMEKLPFDDEKFDIVCSAGSLSYGDNEKVMNEIFRVLKFNGTVIFVDSLNNNLIYKLNRYLNYIKGKRTKSTLNRMPNICLIENYIKKFGTGEAKYFGSISWLFPLLKFLLNEETLTKFSNSIDKYLSIKKSAFKFVLKLRKINK